MATTFVITYRGISIGTARLELTERSGGGPLSPLPGFEIVRTAIADACRARANLGFMPPPDSAVGGVSKAGLGAGALAMAAAQAVCDEMEVLDELGRLVPTECIGVFGGAESGWDWVAMVEFEHSGAMVAARIGPKPKGSSGHSPTEG